jgi:hypothetical protein
MDIAHVLGNLAIAAVCVWLLVKLRAPGMVTGAAALLILAFFLPGLPLIWLLGLLGWRAVKRQPLGGPKPEETEEKRKQRDAALDHLAGV